MAGKRAEIQMDPMEELQTTAVGGAGMKRKSNNARWKTKETSRLTMWNGCCGTSRHGTTATNKTRGD